MILDGQVAVVTGSGRGIGKAIAPRFAREGADIGIIDIDGESAHATAQEVRRLGRRALSIACDVGRFPAVEKGFYEIAHAALFPASPDSRFITGTTLAVDGGAVAAGAHMIDKHRRGKVATA